MATEQDAARDRVLAARAELSGEIERLGVSGRAAMDIPAHVKRSPGKAAAIVGGLVFLALRGPQRILGAVRRRIWGEAAEFPTSMLPEEVEKTLRKLGSDGDKVRGALERDFADYARNSHKERQTLKSLVVLAVARPLLARGARVVGDLLLPTRPGDLSARLEEVRAQAGEGTEQARDGIERARGTAEERIAAVRRDPREPQSPADEDAPTGI